MQPSYLHRDSDIEAMTDGWSDETAYGWHMSLLAPPAYSYAVPGPPARRMLRFWARNSGQFYVRATTASLRMMRTMATRMATEQARHDPATPPHGDRMEIAWRSHGDRMEIAWRSH